MRNSLARDALERALSLGVGVPMRVVYRQNDPAGCPANLPDLDVVCLCTNDLPSVHPRWVQQRAALAVLSSLHRDEMLGFLRAGGRGCMHEDILLPDLVEAMAIVARGGCYLCPRAREIILNPPRLPISERQKQILRAIRELRRRGVRVSAQGIAEHLQLSPKTVYAHMYQIAAALGLSLSVEAVIDYADRLTL